MSKKKATMTSAERSARAKERWEKRKQELQAHAAGESAVTDQEREDADLRAAIEKRLQALEAPIQAAEMAPEPAPPSQNPQDVDALIRANMAEEAKRPVAPPVSVEQEKALAAIMAEQPAAAPETPAKGKRELPKRNPGEDRNAYIERLADLVVAAEKKRRDALLQARKLKIPVGNLPALYDVALPVRRDASAIPDEAVTTPGHWQTWVPKTNQFGEPDTALSKIQELKDWGYRVVTDKEGKPIQERLGVLMEGTPEQRAARIAHKTPVGARRSREQEDQVMEFVENVNREHGKRVLVATDYGAGKD